MSWSVRIQDEMGRGVSGDDIDVPFRILDRLPPNTPMLRGIDRYQDTTFNGMQLEFFVQEWETLASQITNPDDKAVWEKVTACANRCVEEPHLYLKFIGD